MSTGQANTGAELRGHRPTCRDDVLAFHGDGGTVPPLTFFTTGVEITGRLSDALALDGCAHLTFHANRDRGIAFALADQFVDLDHAAHLARQSGAATIIATNPSRQRPGGRA